MKQDEKFTNNDYKVSLIGDHTSYKLSNLHEWKKWTNNIPDICFPSEWKIRIIPPFGNAIVRFMVSTDKTKKDNVSVYLDCYDLLGWYGSPYWEIYPHDGDVFRCDIDDTKRLLTAIQHSIDLMETQEIT